MGRAVLHQLREDPDAGAFSLAQLLRDVERQPQRSPRLFTIVAGSGSVERLVNIAQVNVRRDSQQSTARLAVVAVAVVAVVALLVGGARVLTSDSGGGVQAVADSEAAIAEFCGQVAVLDLWPEDGLLTPSSALTSPEAYDAVAAMRPPESIAETWEDVLVFYDRLRAIGERARTQAGGGSALREIDELQAEYATEGATFSAWVTRNCF
jgi:hypothetical protein